MKRPNFFILGAPKCGTTALAQWLGGHPEVHFSPLKEPHYFNADGRQITKSLAEYEALFGGAGDGHRAVGEGSTQYLYSREAVPRILEYVPEARFVVCLRNPVDMAPALHGECMSNGQEHVKDFERAWRLQTARAQGRHIPATILDDPDRLQYGRYCSLGAQMERLYSWISADRVLPVLLDDVREDPGREYRRVLEFLGLPDDGRQDFAVVNAAKRTRWPRTAVLVKQLGRAKQRLGLTRSLGLAHAIKGVNVQNGARGALRPAFRQELQDYFAPDVAKLGTLLGRDLAHWLR